MIVIRTDIQVYAIRIFTCISVPISIFYLQNIFGKILSFFANRIDLSIFCGGNNFKKTFLKSMLFSRKTTKHNWWSSCADYLKMCKHRKCTHLSVINRNICQNYLFFTLKAISCINAQWVIEMVIAALKPMKSFFLFIYFIYWFYLFIYLW